MEVNVLRNPISEERWWRAFVEEPEPERQSNHYYPGIVAPIVRYSLRGMEEHQSVVRAYRMTFGHHRVCYEHQLSKEPLMEGYLVARFIQTKDNHLCDVEVVETTLPPEMIECLETGLRGAGVLGDTAGTFEVAFRYLPNASRRRRAR
jgi:hypothetical protein